MIDLVFTAVHEHGEELVGFSTLAGTIRPWAGKGTAGNGGPGDESDPGIFAVWDLDRSVRTAVNAREARGGLKQTYHLPLLLTVNEVIIVLH